MDETVETIQLPVEAEDIARVCHEANRAYCVGLNDDSQLPWDDCPEWQRDSARDGVLFHIKNPDASASASHDSWLAHKKADGWKYGATKDADKKEHPCFVPYEQLPLAQRTKDYLFRAIVHAFLDAAESEHA